MKALTICQPYAHLIAVGEKRVENRTWLTRYRGPLAIHAGKSREWLDKGDSTTELVFGAVVALAVLIDCVPYDEEDSHKKYPWLTCHKHALGPYCWVLGNVHAVDPRPYRGQQGLFNIPGVDLLT